MLWIITIPRYGAVERESFANARDFLEAFDAYTAQPPLNREGAEVVPFSGELLTADDIVKMRVELSGKRDMESGDGI